MLYFILSVIFIIIAFLLKPKYMVKSCLYCFGLSALITSMITIFMFFTHPEDHKIKTRISTEKKENKYIKTETDTLKYSAGKLLPEIMFHYERKGD